MWFRPKAWSFQSEWQDSVSVQHASAYAYTERCERETFNQCLCPDKPTLIYSTSGVDYMHFITPTLTDLSLTVSPCFIAIPSHQFAGRLLTWTSIRSHSIQRLKWGACHPYVWAQRNSTQHHLSHFLMLLSIILSPEVVGFDCFFLLPWFYLLLQLQIVVLQVQILIKKNRIKSTWNIFFVNVSVKEKVKSVIKCLHCALYNCD